MPTEDLPEAWLLRGLPPPVSRDIKLVCDNGRVLDGVAVPLGVALPLGTAVSVGDGCADMHVTLE